MEPQHEHVHHHTAAPKENKLTLASAIVIAGLLIAGAIAIPKMSGTGTKKADTNTSIKTVTPTETKYKVMPKDLPADQGHLLGNPAASIRLVVYSDLECPFCKQFHSTMHQVVDKYGDQVVWEYRHYPLNIHPKAQKEAEGAMCAEEQGGNIAFWNYADKIFSITPSNNQLDPSLLPLVAGEIGLDRSAFETCLASDKYAQTVKDQAAEWASPEHGTPSGYILTADGKKTPIQGAMPFDSMTKVIDLLIASK